MSKSKSSAWGRITVPQSGADHEVLALETAQTVAGLLGAELNLLFAAPDPAQLSPWIGEGFMGTVQMSTLEEIKAVSDQFKTVVEGRFAKLEHAPKALKSLDSPMWQHLAIEARLSDMVVFDAAAAKGRGLLAEAFEQVLMQERAGVLVARKPLDFKGKAIVAWDGMEPASRAARRSVPLLKLAREVVVVGAPKGDHPADLNDLVAYYATHGIKAEKDALGKGDISALLNDAMSRHGADFLVAGAFGHSRLREFAFGGTTRALLQNSDMNLYMAH